MSAVVEKTANPIAEVRYQLNNMEDQFKAALPAHIPAERFMRVVMTAVQNNPDLLKADRRSLWNSAMKAAQDGLLPGWQRRCDGRLREQGPMDADDRGHSKEGAQFGRDCPRGTPMSFTRTIALSFELGDEPFIRHKPRARQTLARSSLLTRLRL